MKQLTPLIAKVREFYASFPRIPGNMLKPFVPFLSWYMLLQGVIQIISGFRGVSWGLHYGSLPRMFATLVDVNPSYFFIGGVLTIIAGALYLMAFPKMSQANTRYQGWEKWVLAAGALTITRLYETIFTSGSIIWFLIGTAIGWYFIFEFEQYLKPSKPAKKTTKKPAKKSARKSAKK